MQPDQLFQAKAMLMESIKQRDGALDKCLDMSAQLAVAGVRIIELEGLVKQLQSLNESLKVQIPKDNPPPQEGSQCAE